jgi:hypothetical protein
MPLRETRRILLDGNVVDVVRRDQDWSQAMAAPSAWMRQFICRPLHRRRSSVCI